MGHDFSNTNGGKTGACNKIAGIMSYTEPLKGVWSTCAKNALKAQYNAILNMNMAWCMEGKNYIILFTYSTKNIIFSRIL